ncbi:uncharacterized protein Z518_07024 [Rhinocladiella mackenziei CBS 650.93]|uniref:Uncharacterized protein n=1 Tax=Rhinocladiella mackenziei CBS 650.93 TaxID=1442369 RepID=A0A0D2IJP7_9EURO|nr:uncharacterized protein Z518_07024 [Rhinocladiella mackenziei CBS 650.93]KIX03471.1 hypothetical protein Z518_07024 [Rhinocladiella mackenziei CBS 650.93]
MVDYYVKVFSIMKLGNFDPINTYCELCWPAAMQDHMLFYATLALSRAACMLNVPYITNDYAAFDIHCDVFRRVARAFVVVESREEMIRVATYRPGNGEGLDACRKGTDTLRESLLSRPFFQTIQHGQFPVLPNQQLWAFSLGINELVQAGTIRRDIMNIVIHTERALLNKPEAVALTTTHLVPQLVFPRMSEQLSDFESQLCYTLLALCGYVDRNSSHARSDPAISFPSGTHSDPMFSQQHAPENLNDKIPVDKIAQAFINKKLSDSQSVDRPATLERSCLTWCSLMLRTILLTDAHSIVTPWADYRNEY